MCTPVRIGHFSLHSAWEVQKAALEEKKIRCFGHFRSSSRRVQRRGELTQEIFPPSLQRTTVEAAGAIRSLGEGSVCLTTDSSGRLVRGVQHARNSHDHTAGRKRERKKRGSETSPYTQLHMQEDGKRREEATREVYTHDQHKARHSRVKQGQDMSTGSVGFSSSTP